MKLCPGTNSLKWEGAWNTACVMNSSEGCFECEFAGGVTVPTTVRDYSGPWWSNSKDLPDPLGVKAAAAAAFGEIPSLAG